MDPYTASTALPLEHSFARSQQQQQQQQQQCTSTSLSSGVLPNETSVYCVAFASPYSIPPALESCCVYGTTALDLPASGCAACVLEPAYFNGTGAEAIEILSGCVQTYNTDHGIVPVDIPLLCQGPKGSTSEAGSLVRATPHLAQTMGLALLLSLLWQALH